MDFFFSHGLLLVRLVVLEDVLLVFLCAQEFPITILHFKLFSCDGVHDSLAHVGVRLADCSVSSFDKFTMSKSPLLIAWKDAPEEHAFEFV